MRLPTTECTPDNPEDLPPARRRRAHRLVSPMNSDERAALLEELGHRISPSFDFFLFTLISGMLLSVGLLIDEPAILILGAVLAPLMAPVIGISLGTVIGSSRFFVRNLIGLLISCSLVLLVGYLAGVITKGVLAGRNWLFQEHSQIYFFSQISWINFLVLTVAAILTTSAITSMENKSSRPPLSSVALAYLLYLPIATSGLGLGCGIPHLWPDGLVVFSLHLTWCILVGIFTLIIKGFRPLTLFGYTLSGVIVLIGIILVIGISVAGVAIRTHLGLPTPVPSPTPTLTSTPTQTPTPLPPTSTYTPTPSLSPTFTPTISSTPTATSVFAVIRTDLPEGVRIRAEPGGEVIGFLSNNTVIILLSEIVEKEGTIWVHILTTDGKRGWIVQSLIVVVTTTLSAP